MSVQFLGFDHADVRVPSISAVESFYDKLMPRLGLSEKRFAFVDDRGEWFDADDSRGYNTVEYHEPPQDGRSGCFIGFIEHRAMQPVLTRIAFRVERADLQHWHDYLRSIGANAEFAADPEAYPALFFEDPAGTKLELVARKHV
jgi:catechol 2,3-dioxygenase-like lactoylglutathione lyase family enzyme